VSGLPNKIAYDLASACARSKSIANNMSKMGGQPVASRAHGAIAESRP
jgi:hypothetical protein